MSKSVINQISENSIYKCDNCRSNINNKRFHCTICKNFDYCEECKLTKVHLHEFIELKVEGNIRKLLTLNMTFGFNNFNGTSSFLNPPITSNI